MSRAIVGRVLGPTYDKQGSSTRQIGEGTLVYPGIAFLLGTKGTGHRDEAVEKMIISPKDGLVDMERGLRTCTVQARQTIYVR